MAAEGTTEELTASSPRRESSEPGVAAETVAVPLPGTEPRLRPTRRRRGRQLVVSYLLTVFVLITANFALPRGLPGDPVDALLSGESPHYVHSDVIRSQLNEYYGLDLPLWDQYRKYLSDLATGELGTSIRYNVPVAQLVAERLPWTLLLMGSAITLAISLGWVAGVHSAWRRGRLADRGLLAVFLGLHSFPVFFVGSLALFAFGVKLGWVPLAGSRTHFATTGGALDAVRDVAHHLVLPASVLALQFATSQYLNMRASMVGELGSDYLLAGRAKGLAERRIKYRYAARNALLPVVALTGVHIGIAVTQLILVETVFAYQGLGRLTFDAVAFRDYPALQACFLVLTLVVVTANFAADALNARLDPRIGA
ncbi:MAG TPA: ABC transporter permease [Acidimicrobiales bacterium]|nr:ABC transporter permease [Acidimicrobiales bacterium]